MPRRRRRHQEPEEAPKLLPAGDLPVIKVVGMSAGGKSTLVRNLRARGYNARAVSQEHANVPDLWQQFERTHRLIYLGITLEGQRARRPDVTWSDQAYRAEHARLAHARDHADVRIDTTGLSPAEILELAIQYLQSQKVRHADGPLEPVPQTGTAKRPPDTGTDRS